MKRTTIHLPLLALALVLPACGDDETSDPTGAGSSGGTTTAGTTTTGATTTATTTTTTMGSTTDMGSTGAGADANIRVLHLSPDAPNVDIFVNDAAAGINDLAFQAGTPYVQLPADSYKIDIVPAGGAIGDSVLTIDALALDADTSYTAVAYDEVANLTVAALVDDTANIAAGANRIVVSHFAPAVPTVDIWEISDPMNPAMLLTDVPFGATATLDDVPAGPLELGFDIDDDMMPDVTFSVPDLGADQQINVFAANDDNDNPFLLAQLPDGSTPVVNPN